METYFPERILHLMDGRAGTAPKGFVPHKTEKKPMLNNKDSGGNTRGMSRARVEGKIRQNIDESGPARGNVVRSLVLSLHQKFLCGLKTFLSGKFPPEARKSPACRCGGWKHAGKVAGSGLFLSLSVFCAGMLAAYAGARPSGTGGVSSSRVVLPVSFALLNAGDLPGGANTLLPDPALFSLRHAAPAPAGAGGVLSDAGPETMRDFSAFLPSSGKHAVLNFMRGRVLFGAPDGETAEITPLDISPASVLHSLSEPPDIFRVNLFTPARSRGGETLIPMFSGEARDEAGPARPGTDDAFADHERKLCLLDSYYAGLMRLTLRGGVPPRDGGTISASRYRSAIGRYAEQYRLNPALIMAVMHTESNFNPSAVSPGRAVGLMQLVPDTAGSEVHRYLTGSPAMPEQDILFSPEHNIRYGTVYLHLLGRRYFGGVYNSLSRQLCVIAAYNGGPNAVLRLFDPADARNAVQRINELGPERLYEQLTTRMPHRETRRYIEIVLARMLNYAGDTVF
jgi:membrane-bound lytic murein transglycosylase C